MTTESERLPSRANARPYTPEITPMLQSLLAALADIDLAYESDLEVIQNSAIDGVLKQRAIENLQQQHRERRKPSVRQLTALQHRIQAIAA
ncbi:hypothetical protein [Microvirga massiliensis]|uniref:hypothetical protein n=1 Tax=Microvirga massiliensis TaxID=1033741 RepID=UPI0006606691|nr:hypothetical protein [Microvirga massiliensis]